MEVVEDKRPREGETMEAGRKLNEPPVTLNMRGIIVRERAPRASGMRAVVAAPHGDLPHVPLNGGPPGHNL